MRSSFRCPNSRLIQERRKSHERDLTTQMINKRIFPIGLIQCEDKTFTENTFCKQPYIQQIRKVNYMRFTNPTTKLIQSVLYRWTKCMTSGDEKSNVFNAFNEGKSSTL